MRSGVPAAASVQRAHDDALGELDLVGVVARTAARSASAASAARAKAARVRRGALEQRLGGARAPRLRRHPAEGEARPADRAAGDLERRPRPTPARRRTTCARGASGSGHAPRNAAASAGRRRATMSSPGASAVSRSGRVAGQPVQLLERQRRAGRPGRRSRRRRRAPPAARRSRTGAWRCRHRSSRGSRGRGSRRPARRSPRPARAGCRRWPGRRSRRSACAASGCRRPSRRCAAAREAPDSSASATAG